MNAKRGTPSLWTTQGPHQFPVLPSDDLNNENPSRKDEWGTLAEEKRAEVHAKCSAWTDEIQNLLTFIGLFSAVVAGFLVTTYSSLSVDSVDVNTFVLAQVAHRLDVSIGLANVTSVPPLSLSPPFDPTPFLIYVHTFWFASLALSLSTAVVAVLCLQWIREYQRAPTLIDARATFLVYTMRTEAFNRWQVPNTIALLPVALQTALILFFIGLIQFLLPLGNRIAVPTIAIIAATLLFLLFLLFTTVAPGFQILLYDEFKFGYPFHNAHDPCPYQSPQAWRSFLGAAIILIAAFAVSITLLCLIGAVFFTVELIIVLVCRPLGCRRLRKPAKVLELLNQCILGIPMLFRSCFDTFVGVFSNATARDWYGVDDFWLGFRDTVLDCGTQSIKARMPSHLRQWHYIAQGFASISTHPHIMYQCINNDSVPIASVDDFPIPKNTISFIYDKANARLESRRLLTSWRDPPVSLCRAEYQLMLINTFPATHDLAFGSDLLIHQLELYIQVLGGIFVGVGDGSMGPWMECATNGPGLTSEAFVPRLLRVRKRGELLLPIRGAEQCIEQLILVFSNFIETLLDYATPPTIGQYHRSNDILALMYFVISPFVDFISSTAAAVEGGDPVPASLCRMLEAFTRTHHLLSAHLTKVLSETHDREPPSPVVWLTVHHYLITCMVDAKAQRPALLTNNVVTRTDDYDKVVPVLRRGVVWMRRAPTLPWDEIAKLRTTDALSVVDEYVSSFKSLFQLVDTLLLTRLQKPHLADHFEPGVFSDEHRFTLLDSLNIARVKSIAEVQGTPPLMNPGVLTFPVPTPFAVVHLAPVPSSSMAQSLSAPSIASSALAEDINAPAPCLPSPPQSILPTPIPSPFNCSSTPPNSKDAVVDVIESGSTLGFPFPASGRPPACKLDKVAQGKEAVVNAGSDQDPNDPSPVLIPPDVEK